MGFGFWMWIWSAISSSLKADDLISPLEIMWGFLDCGCGWRTRCEREEKRATFGSLLCRCCCWCCCRRNDGYLFIVLSWCSICGLGGGGDAVLGSSTLESDLVTFAIAHLSSCSSSCFLLLPSGVGQSGSSNHWTVGCDSSGSCCCSSLLFSSQSFWVLFPLSTSFLHFILLHFAALCQILPPYLPFSFSSAPPPPPLCSSFWSFSFCGLFSFMVIEHHWEEEEEEEEFENTLSSSSLHFKIIFFFVWNQLPER